MRTCCLACALQGSRIPGYFIKRLEKFHVKAIADMRTQVRRVCSNSISVGGQLKLQRAARRVFGRFGYGSHIFHPRFHQSRVLTLTNGEAILAEKQQGTIIQLIDYGRQPKTGSDYVEGIIQDSLRPRRHGTQFPDLDGIPIMGALQIFVHASFMVYHQSLTDYEIIELDPEKKTANDIMDDIERRLVFIDNISVIALHGAEYLKPDEMLDFEMWFGFFKQQYGYGLDDMWVVCLIDGEWIQTTRGLPNSDESRRYINHEINQSLEQEDRQKLTLLEVRGRGYNVQLGSYSV